MAFGIFKKIDRWIEQIPTFHALNEAKKNAFQIPDFDPENQRYIIFSDIHKGDGRDNDDFKHNELIYLKALQYYLSQDYRLILNGDIEELWEASYAGIRTRYGEKIFPSEADFRKKGAEYYVRIFGNHDYEWKQPDNVKKILLPDFGDIKAYEAAMLGNHIFIIHGHQGDPVDDPDRFKEVSVLVKIWGVYQRSWVKVRTMIGIKRPMASNNQDIRETRDRFLYEWAKQNQLLLIAGHTHKAIFQSWTRTGQLQNELESMQVNQIRARVNVDDVSQSAAEQFLQHAIEVSPDDPAKDKARPVPCYFNSGCCLYENGITGIEISGGQIRLIKWEITDSFCDGDEHVAHDPMTGYYIIRRIYQMAYLSELFSAIDTQSG